MLFRCKEGDNPDNAICFIRHTLFFFVAHIPFRILINFILYLAIFSLLLHLGTYYIEKHPKEVEKYINDNFSLALSFDSLQANYNLLRPSFQLNQVQVSLAKKGTNNDTKNTNLATTEQALPLKINSVAISFELLRSIIFFQPYIYQLSLDGVDINITRHNHSTMIGSYELVDQPSLQLQKPKLHELIIPIIESLPEWLLKLNRFHIINSTVDYSEPATSIQQQKIKDLAIHISNTEWEHKFFVSAQPIDQNIDQNESGLIDFSALLKGSIYDRHKWNGNFYLNLENQTYQHIKTHLASAIKTQLDNSPIQINDALLSLQIWGNFADDNFQDVAGKLNLSNIQATYPKNQQNIVIDDISTIFSIQNNTSFLLARQYRQNLKSRTKINFFNVNFNINKASMTLAHVALLLEKRSDSLDYRLYSPMINLDGIDQFVNNFLTTDQKQNIAAPPTIKGTIEQLQLRWQDSYSTLKDKNDFQFFAKVKNLQQQNILAIPSFKNLSANIWYSPKGGMAKINSTDFEISITPTFRYPLRFSSFKTQLSWQEKYQQYYISAEDSQLKNKHLSLNGKFNLWANKDNFSNPLLFIHAYYADTYGEYTPLYLPTGIMNEGLTKWLDHAIVKGVVPFGGVIHRGRLQDFPFSKHQGVLDVVFDTQDAELNYFPGWPHLQKIRSKVQFTHSGMSIEGQFAKLFDAQTNFTQVSLADYNDDSIKLISKIHSTTQDNIKFLSQTKLIDDYLLTKLKDNSKGTGKVDIELDIDIPIEDNPVRSKIKAQINQAVYYPNWLKDKAIEKINGKFLIHNQVLKSLALKGKLDKEDINFKLQPSKNNNIKLQVQGTAKASLLKAMEYIPLSLKPLLKQLSGKTSVNASIFIPNKKPEQWRLNIKTDLLGLNSQLPQPLNKKQNNKRSLEVSVKNKADKQQIHVDFHKDIHLCALVPIDNESKKIVNSSQTQFNLFLGSAFKGMQKKLCQQQQEQIILSGYWDIKNIEKWLALLEKADIPVSEQNKALKLKVEIDKLELSKPFNNKTTKKAQNKNKIPINKKDKKASNILVNGEIQELYIDKLKIGKVSISSKKINHYLLRHNFNLSGELIDIKLSSLTDSSNSSLKTTLNTDISIKDTGDLLTKLDYYDALKLTPLTIKGDLEWQDDIWNFSIADLSGKLKLTTQSGVLSKIDPGAARILGVFNLNNLQEKLKANDKSNVETGFHFYSIKGDLIFDKGKLLTPDVNIVSSIAKITLSGFSDLILKQHHQLVRVFPDVSSGLTYAGLFLGGPAGAAIGWIGQKIIGDQVNKINKYEYDINGSWHEPEIKLRVSQ